MPMPLQKSIENQQSTRIYCLIGEEKDKDDYKWEEDIGGSKKHSFDALNVREKLCINTVRWENQPEEL